MLKFIANAIAFNLCWFALVLQGNWAVPWVITWVIVHILIQQDSWREMQFILAVAAIGVMVDSILTASGVLIFAESTSRLPLWMVSLWLGFATTLNHSLAVLNRSRLARVLVAIAGAPSSYLLGSRLGQVELGLNVLATYLVFALTWVLLLEIFARLPFHPDSPVSASTKSAHPTNS